MKVTNASSHSGLPPHLPLKVDHRRNFATSVGGLWGTMAYGNVDADEPILLPVVPGTPKHNRNCWDKHNQGCICDIVSYWEVPWPYFPATARNMWEDTAEEECPTEDSILSALPKERRTVTLCPPKKAENRDVSSERECPLRWDAAEEHVGTKHHTGW